MLYRTRRISVPAIARAAVIRVVDAAKEMRRTSVDTSRFDGLSEYHLRDLGLRRYEDRHFHETFYR
jgi:hypothetical protein